MALKPLQGSTAPLGQYDGLDADVLVLKGGEVVTIKSLTLASSDQASPDVFDGYTRDSNVQKRSVVTKTLATGNRPLMLADEGISGYGTILGSVVGGVVGINVAGTQVGPSTATGSGKVTCHFQPGLYAVSLDAVDTTTSTGLVPTNTTLATGAPLYATTAGLLTPNVALAFEASLVVGRFIEFSTDGSLVKTPTRLAGAKNSPTGYPETLRQFQYAVFFFNPPTT